MWNSASSRQEALENAFRHARASCFEVTLTGDAARLRMAIRDDGVGFDPSAVEPGRHFGLRGIRERAGLIHAAAEVDGGSGHGTRLSLTWHHSEAGHALKEKATGGSGDDQRTDM